MSRPRAGACLPVHLMESGPLTSTAQGYLFFLGCLLVAAREAWVGQRLGGHLVFHLLPGSLLRPAQTLEARLHGLQELAVY